MKIQLPSAYVLVPNFSVSEVAVRGLQFAVFVAFATVVAGCGGGGGGSTPPAPTPHASGATPAPSASGGVPTPTASAMHSPTPSPSPTATATPTPAPTVPPLPTFVSVWSGFYGNTIAQFPSGTAVRQMVFLPNGDLLVGEGGGAPSAAGAVNNHVWILPQADSATAAVSPSVFAAISPIDTTCQSTGTGVTQSVALPATTQGVAYQPNPTSPSSGGTIFVGTECAVYTIPYTTGEQSASSTELSQIKELIKVRTGPIWNFTVDGDVHHTTSVTVSGSTLYVGVGSSCNACTELDSTRAVVLKYTLAGSGASISASGKTTVATHLRNPIALAVNPATNSLWAGGAGQDCAYTSSAVPPLQALVHSCNNQDSSYATDGHPYEFIDPVTKHASPADYMWPNCEENNVAILSGTNCSNMVVGAVRAPAYSTIIGAAFYPNYTGTPPTYAFPSTFYGGLFFSMHGSWHESVAPNVQVAKPAVTFVAMTKNSDVPSAGNWNGGLPTSQWSLVGNDPFMYNFQPYPGMDTRVGQPAGVAVGPNGSLFVSDDKNGVVYRIRYGVMPASLRYAPFSIPRKR